jgi:N-methylhydantoinase A|tara:strand:- start:1544 stop:3631 length:2088 start_codon:yes stop_codon:yes gene_type:complete
MNNGFGYRIGIDVGGTFTDVVLISNETGETAVTKTLNRNLDRAVTVVDSVEILLKETGVNADKVDCISHGTTITTNAVIERKGAKTALITNKNFRDILEIGRFSRPADLIYRIHEDKPPPLVPRYLRLGISCRVDRNGKATTEINEKELSNLIEEIKELDVESVAVCFLFSFLNPIHEEQVRKALSGNLPDIDVVLSSEILREFREFPRTATTVFSAYVAPVLRNYIMSLLNLLSVRGISCPLYIFQSNGGVSQPDIIMRNPALTLLSGPAGAVVGAAQLCGQAGYRDLITMDIGGTSLDVCLINNSTAEATTTREIDMFPVGIPMLDVHTIGAGGGSIVRIDDVGRVKVGPDSMGANPGPSCYGLGGDQTTLTDINLLLGLLNAKTFANGEVPLDIELAKSVVKKNIADPLGVDIPAATVGVYRVATNQIAEAIRTVTVERGSDPRDYSLVAFGGGGPLHASAVALELGLSQIIVPRHPGLFSARGIATADFSHDYIQSIVRPISKVAYREINDSITDLKKQALKDLNAEDVPINRQEMEPALDLRYLGQTTEITVPIKSTTNIKEREISDVVSKFHQLHERLYSYSVVDEPVELVNIRLRAIGTVPKPPVVVIKGDGEKPSPVNKRQVFLPNGKGSKLVPVFSRDHLKPGAEINGPALIEELSSTTLVLDEMKVTVDAYENMIITLDKVGQKI